MRLSQAQANFEAVDRANKSAFAVLAFFYRVPPTGRGPVCHAAREAFAAKAMRLWPRFVEARHNLMAAERD
jgi:hypothetical protein